MLVPFSTKMFYVRMLRKDYILKFEVISCGLMQYTPNERLYAITHACSCS